MAQKELCQGNGIGMHELPALHLFLDQKLLNPFHRAASQHHDETSN